ncbi:hypothetical protein JEQ12_020310 [Ovis aries]|uniref:Spermatid nuclear transition protein 3-like n=1 Tax=Ovis aries TaxID=9940 RepID=A0A835ZKT7_SHEEP|nr:hypothetical protein JEQ12_020310 [Ovis aries]
MRFASKMNGKKKTLCQRRYRGSVKARNTTMRVRRPLQGTMRKKIRSYATQSKKVKKTRKPNCFFCSCGRKKLNQSRKRIDALFLDGIIFLTGASSFIASIVC